MLLFQPLPVGLEIYRFADSSLFWKISVCIQLEVVQVFAIFRSWTAYSDVFYAKVANVLFKDWDLSNDLSSQGSLVADKTCLYEGLWWLVGLFAIIPCLSFSLQSALNPVFPSNLIRFYDVIIHWSVLSPKISFVTQGCFFLFCFPRWAGWK